MFDVSMSDGTIVEYTGSPLPSLVVNGESGLTPAQVYVLSDVAYSRLCGKRELLAVYCQIGDRRKLSCYYSPDTTVSPFANQQ